MFDYQATSNPLDLPNMLYAQTAPHPSDRTVSAITPAPSTHVHTVQLDSEIYPIASNNGTFAIHPTVTHESTLVGTGTQSHHYAFTECENIGHCPAGYMVGQACSGSSRGAAASGFCYESSSGTMECGRALSITGRFSSTPTPLAYAEAPDVAKSRCPAGFPLTATGAKLTARSVLHGGCMNPTDPNYDSIAGVHVPEMCDTMADYMKGCLFPGARNYAPGSRQSGKCLYNVNGCINPAALNYNSEANVDDGSCVMRTDGCTVNSAPYNPVTAGTPMYRGRYVNGRSGSAPYNQAPIFPAYAPVLNYNPAANVNTGCTIAIEGCMTEGAVNYDPAATVNSNTWCIPRVLGCMMPPLGNTATSSNSASRSHLRDGGTGNYSTIATVNVPSQCTRGRQGCNVTGSVNYDPYATIMVGKCYTRLVGCLDRTALNFNCTTIDSYAPCALADPPTEHLASVCNYFLSPPPAPSPAGPPGSETAEVVSISVTVAADLSQFTPPVISNMENATAVQAGVSVEDVTITVAAASVRIVTDIRTASSSGTSRSADEITAAMETVMATPEAAATFLASADPELAGVQVLSTPVLETKVKPVIAPAPPPDNSTGAIVGGIIGGVVGLLLIAALLFFMRKKNKATYPA